MAKKDPTDLSVEEKLKTLYQLQTTLSSIDEKRALRGELPLEVQDLEDELEAAKNEAKEIYNEYCDDSGKCGKVKEQTGSLTLRDVLGL